MGKEIRNETKNLISKSNSTFFSNIEKSKLIYKRINQILGKLFDIHKEEFSKDKQLELILLNPFFKSYFDLKELNYLVNNLFLQFIDYKKIFEVTDYEDFLSKFFLKSNIYKILLNSDISLDKLAMNLSYLTIDEKISLEFNKILINNPSLIIIGNNIDKLSEENQFKILNKINSYILANEAIGIYFLNNINVASKLTTDINIIMNSKTIEQGKTNIIVDNPINPVVKRLLNKEDEKSKTLYDDFLSKIDDFENIFKYEIEPDHFV
ncbi:ABC-type antimicrobial peptide transport system%2C ATPase component [Chlamydia trachomatis]|nr:ABC-type antimicrobial peptide transport system%2C ATPase component [Chlamydia trachomatis]CRH46945.1 ABC-type antimicrobial peptide transport system%2C ATPase component [Chlamydia trachomatis]CRH55091.1 ABC-type antimicrobial peptide transport system%2C ATPase component [Chlamydia trachomatis]